MANPYASATIDASGNVRLGYTAVAGPLKGTPLAPALPLRASFRVPGVLADQVDGWAWVVLQLVASTPQLIDLTTLVDLQGNPLTAARVRVVAAKWGCQTDGAALLLGGASTNPWLGFLTAGSKLAVGPSSTSNDGWCVITSPQTTGMPITGTSKSLKADPQTGAGQLDLILGVCST